MIDLQVYGSAFACRTVAEGLGRLTTVAGGTVDTLTGARDTVQSSWTGMTADAAGARLSALRSEMATLEEQTQAVGAGLRGFADELDVVSNRMADIAGDGWKLWFGLVFAVGAVISLWAMLFLPIPAWVEPRWFRETKPRRQRTKARTELTDPDTPGARSEKP